MHACLQLETVHPGNVTSRRDPGQCCTRWQRGNQQPQPVQGSIHRHLQMRCVPAQVAATASAGAATCPATTGSGSGRIRSAGARCGRGRQVVGGRRDGSDSLRVSALQVQQAAHAVRHLRQRMLSFLTGPGAPSLLPILPPTGRQEQKHVQISLSSYSRYHSSSCLSQGLQTVHHIFNLNAGTLSSAIPTTVPGCLKHLSHCAELQPIGFAGGSGADPGAGLGAAHERVHRGLEPAL